MDIRKWHCQMRRNGSINVVETDLIGLQRVVFNLRYIGEKDALKISISREMFDLLKEISALQYDQSLSVRINELLETVNKEIE